jgi:hypothetical protein
MYELILVGSGFVVGAITTLAIFRYGISYATRLIYKIKEDVPLEEIGTPMEHEETT